MLNPRLRYFCAVAEELNITRAALFLNISQQALSSQISQLEEEFQVRFFERQKHGMKLTPAGDFFYRYARKALEQEQEMNADILSFRQGARGTLRIGSSHTRAMTMLPPVVARFAETHRDTKVIVHVLTSISLQLEKKLVSGELDMIITPAKLSLEGVKSILLSREYFCLSIPRKFIETILLPGQSIRDFAALPSRSQWEQISASRLLERIPCVFVAWWMAQQAKAFLRQQGIAPQAVIDLHNLENLYAIPYYTLAATFTFDALVKPYVVCDSGGVPNIFFYTLDIPGSPVSVSVFYRQDAINSDMQDFIDLLCQSCNASADDPGTLMPKQNFLPFVSLRQ